MTTLTLFGTNGNGANGPGFSTGFSGNYVAGTLFKVTSSGYQLTGYGFWRADNSQSGSVSFALWEATGAGTGTLVPGSTASLSGMTAGAWNYVSLGTPITLTSGQVYKAQAGLVNNFPLTGGQFASGGVYAAGITNGVLAAFSDSSGSAPDSFSDVQCSFTTSTADPTADYATSSDGGYNAWIDVQIAAAGGTPVSGTDSGSGADTAQVETSSTDTGTGADTGTVLAAAPGSDSGSGAETASIGVTSPDAGSGADTGSAAATVSGADTGSGADLAGIGVTGPDSGTGTDTGTVAASIPGADTGTGTEGTPAIGAAGPDAGSGADSGTIGLASTDSGAGADSGQVAIAGADAGIAADSGTTTASLPGTDTGSGGDAGVASVPVSGADTGAGADSATAAVVVTVPELRAGLLGGSATSGNAYGGTTSNVNAYAGSAS